VDGASAGATACVSSRNAIHLDRCYPAEREVAKSVGTTRVMAVCVGAQCNPLVGGKAKGASIVTDECPLHVGATGFEPAASP
jgi:hypothetical protein